MTIMERLFCLKTHVVKLSQAIHIRNKVLRIRSQSYLTGSTLDICYGLRLQQTRESNISIFVDLGK